MTIGLFGLWSCDLADQSDAEVLARVYQEKLTLDELSVPAENVDSLTHVQEQTDAWALRQLWAHAAQDIPYTPRMERLVDDYKNSLLIAAYQKELFAQNNLNVDDQMIVDYYKENQSNFVLDKDLYKIQFFQITEELDASVIIPGLNEGVAGDDLTMYCEANPEECMFRAAWVEPSTLEAIELPEYLWKTSGKFSQFYKTDGKTIIYRIEAKRTVGETIPLDMLREKIVSILSFQHEQDIIEKHEAELLQKAQNENHFEIY